MKKEQKGRGSSSLLLQLVLTLLASWLAFSIASKDRSQTPCGTPLPEVPVLVERTDTDFDNISVMQGRIPDEYLQFLAPQPDGAMPLRYPHDVYRSDFSMMLPMGCTTIPLGDTFEEDAIDSQVIFKFDQQLDYIKISLPMREEGESVSEFVARARHDYEQLGAEFRENTEALEMDGMLFQHFEYDRLTQYAEDEPEQEVSHYVYFGPAGVRALVIDFITTPERHELARPVVEKIMRSIEPGDRFLQQMHLEYPDRFADPLAPATSTAEETGDQTEDPDETE